jgi:diguanylate cyclase (GGDEF)-like protein
VNRSTGLLRAYASLLVRVSGAETVSLYAASPTDGSPLFLIEGAVPLPELADAESARRTALLNAEIARDAAAPKRIPSGGAPGFFTAVECVPFAKPARREDRRRGRQAKDAPSPAADSRICWIGLRFPEGAESEIRSSEAFHRLTEQWPSLLSLGGVLAWYASQISSILDDPVTGLAGRAEFQASLRHSFDQARDGGRPLTLLFINPDDFTSVNERFGHDAGDRILREIGRRLRASHRASDSVAKYGGVIFASFLPDTDAASGRVVAEKVWSALAETSFVDGTLRLGISVGLATFEPGAAGIDGHLELIRRGDKALNAAKRYGGDRVVAWDPDLDSRDLGNLDRMTGVYTGNMAKDYRNMTLLSEAMTVVAGSTDAEDLVEQVVDRLYTTLKPDHAGIFEWDGEGDPLLVAGLTKTALSPGGHEGVPGLELSPRKLALLEEARREAKALSVSFTDDYSEHRILAFAVPLLLNELCLGCLYIDGRVDTIALEGSADLGFLRAFATQLAVALDRARLSHQQKRQQEREQSRLRAEVDDLRRALNHTKLVYRSREMEAVLDVARRVAPTKATVLLIGESGTGKELVARTIHELSPFRAKPLVVVDCGAIPTTLIESELFGHERGAYTGAQERRIGRLLEAEGGTVVLDEIGELPLEVQSKLLRFVQERQVVPVGGTRVRHVDTRLIAVTNRELAVEAAAGRFREDLFYRLNVVRITVPPLRERPEDILYLAEHFLEHFAGQYQKGALRFTDHARDSLIEHTWPGNVRELSNRIMQAVILSERSEIGWRELELESLLPEQTVEIDLSVMKRASAQRDSETRLLTAPHASRSAPGNPEEAWEELRLALRRQVVEAVREGAREPLPLGMWLVEDLVLSAYDAAGGVSGRARALLGIPETTFRRKLSKATSRERAGLLTRRPPWNEVSPSIDALVRASEEAREDVLDTARSVLLQEVVAHTDDPVRGAALMGVTLRTYRRWTQEVPSPTAGPRERPLLPVIS